MTLWSTLLTCFFLKFKCTGLCSILFDNWISMLFGMKFMLEYLILKHFFTPNWPTVGQKCYVKICWWKLWREEWWFSVPPLNFSEFLIYVIVSDLFTSLGYASSKMGSCCTWIATFSLSGLWRINSIWEFYILLLTWQLNWVII